MKRVLVTGGAGFLGTHLCNALAARGDEVIALYRDVRPHPLGFTNIEKLTQIMGDVQNQELVRRVVSQFEVDAVVHLAAQTQVSVGIANPETMFRENVLGALSVLEACRLQKPSPRVIIASTDKVYGSESLPYTEETRLAERTPYGASKICADVIAQTYLSTYRMPVAITRCGNLYGPGHMNWSALIPGTIRKFLREERPQVKFGGLATRDFLYVDDAVAAYLLLLDTDGVGPFNFSGGRELKIIEVVQLIAAEMGRTMGEVDVTAGNPGEIVNQRLNCALAEGWLGWKPKVTFEEGIRETVRWYRSTMG